MPLFGEKQDRTADDQAARAKLHWADSVPPADLAAELMSVAFRGSSDLSMEELIGRLLVPRRHDMQSRRDVKRAVGSTKELERAVLEAIQLLEHSELILCAQRHVTGYDHQHHWRATRLGLETMDNGKDLVRQRIKDRTGQ